MAQQGEQHVQRHVCVSWIGVTVQARLRRLSASHRTLEAIRHSVRFPPEGNGEPLEGNGQV